MIPEDFRDLLADETRAYAFLATTMGDGSPQVTPVWFDCDGDLVQVNTVRGRVKDRNMRARPKVALAIIDLREPNRYMQLRGTVQEWMEEGAEAHIRKLARKYMGTTAFEWDKDDTRVLFRIRVDAVQTMD